MLHEIQRRDLEIRQLNSDLERRVAGRTAELEATNRELEAFTYSVSHDLRAPVRHVAGFCELLEKRSSATMDDIGRRYLGNIADAAKRMGALIDDLLLFSRMGRSELQSSRVSLESLLAEVIRELEPETQGRNVVWKIGSLPEVQADPSMLRVVLTNLVANALKYTGPRPEARIEIGAEVRDSEIVVSVRDNGVGFDMAYHSKLFGVFQRLHSAEEFEGTGIGLANVRRIVHRHGGKTWAEGQVDHGATFFFSLPELEEAA
jgi:light-regulated signal transduction histidine kinase (bacteriophytochrome)